MWEIQLESFAFGNWLLIVQLGVFTYYVRKDYLRDPVNVGDSIRKPKIIT